mmetsp:Transcript_38233/g.113538  ORF Transcript_38233/g.113538 Transcript_38233/m.113538 type:complete len:263 (-) Transcript_38233:38-826(-)
MATMTMFSRGRPVRGEPRAIPRDSARRRSAGRPPASRAVAVVLHARRGVGLPVDAACRGRGRARRHPAGRLLHGLLDAMGALLDAVDCHAPEVLAALPHLDDLHGVRLGGAQVRVGQRPLQERRHLAVGPGSLLVGLGVARAVLRGPEALRGLLEEGDGTLHLLHEVGVERGGVDGGLLGEDGLLHLLASLVEEVLPLLGDVEAGVAGVHHVVELLADDPRQRLPGGLGPGLHVLPADVLNGGHRIQVSANQFQAEGTPRTF